MTVRTRFAPSPTGYLHIGGARTALYSWAFARRHGGKFILRIEDTDTERSTRESEDAILDSMKWLGLDWDEGPFFQMQRLARYREVAERLIAAGDAYHCWATKEELDAMREAQRARGEKPRYDGRWRPERAKAAGLMPPKDRPPVVRFRTPEEGTVGWNDLVKGPIEFANTELDDLVIMRADGVPTYNFGVVVDDLDMRMTHVIRGDDHVNNTPRQIHIFRALGSMLPEFAHVPMILGADGERLSKRHGAVSVTQYRDEGFLPEALVNYLARLGWSHGDDEVFSMRQLVEWFDLAHVSRSPAKFDIEKLRWLNKVYIDRLSVEDRRKAMKDFWEISEKPEVLTRIKVPVEKSIDLMWATESTLGATSTAIAHFHTPHEEVPLDLERQYITPASISVLKDFLGQLTNVLVWDKTSIRNLFDAILKRNNIKMPQLAMPLRVVIWGTTKTKAIDESLEALGREEVILRLAKYLSRT